MDLREYFRVLRRRWLIIVACLLLGTAVGALIIIRSTPQYAATARLFVSTPSSDANAQAYQGGLFSQQRVTAYADLIKGSTVAEKVIAELQLDETPAALVAQISAVAAPDSVILQVTATDPDPARAQQLAQTTAEVFADFVAELENPANPAESPITANIVDAAGLPTSPVSPRPLVTIGLGGVLGLLVGLGLAWLRETLDTSIKDPEVLKEVTGSAMLGSIYYDAGAAKNPLIANLDPHSPRVESFRVLRTNLQFLDVDRESNTFAITSPLPGDGKSTTAINIALTVAQTGKSTLLLETDLRRPRISEYLNLESVVGLTTALIGRADIADVIQRWGTSGLDVITSGAIPPNPAELLQSRAMTLVLAELQRRYDVIIIDAPPLLPVTDAALIASESDGAILVVRHGKTTKDQASQAKQRLDSVGATLLGTVLNFVPEKGLRGYGYGYGYGYGNGPKTSDPKAPIAPPAEQMKADLTSASTDDAPTAAHIPTAPAQVESPSRVTSDGVPVPPSDVHLGR